MEVEFTARQVKIAKALRTKAEESLERFTKLLGKSAQASVVFSEQRHLQHVEVTVLARAVKLVATGKGDTQAAALKEAIEHAEAQALRFRERKLDRKRLPKEEKEMATPPGRQRTRGSATEEPKATKPAKKAAKKRSSITVPHAKGKKRVEEPHLLSAGEAVADRPLTIEEAVKQAEANDRDLLVFRNADGDLFVLHRRRDGEMELVEVA